MHASGQATTTLALEMEDPAGLLDEIVQHPLLTIPRQTRSATDGFLWAGHVCAPLQTVWSVSELRRIGLTGRPSPPQRERQGVGPLVTLLGGPGAHGLDRLRN